MPVRNPFKLTNLTENDTLIEFDPEKIKTELMILFLIATGLQFIATLAFFILYNKNPLPANIAESRRQSVRTALNRNGKSFVLQRGILVES